MSPQHLLLWTPKVTTKLSPEKDRRRREPDVPLPSAHLEHLVALVLVPGSTVGEVPVRLLDDTEERVRVGLVDKHFDRIAHFL